ncbi:MAG: RagB/SusD family nutrient uptake outer membrane protein [Muribaculaceae bacterium]|nr:RagB/SusD family nutrient uptake outer membrane protein [Muribaculaceae bacterium]
MKTKIIAALTLAAASMTALTGCMEDKDPMGGTITQDQLNATTKAGGSTLAAIPSMIIYVNTDNSDHHCDIGYAGMMIMRDRMTGDMTINCNGTNYDQFSYYAQGYNDEGYWMPQLILNYYSKLILATNKAAATFPAGIETEDGQGCRAIALAYRALAYLDVARWYEYLPCDKTKAENAYGNNVLNLTYPIVTEETTMEAATNNPRATRQQMFKFIKSDLDYAAENIEKAPEEYNTFIYPNLAVVYGLYARLYMWVEDYAKAKEYADLAISTHGGSPLTEAQWTDAKSGFNTPDGNTSWMLGSQLTAENRAVTTGICNFVSFLSPEATYGYAAAGAEFDIDYNMYTRINNSDFRKLSWCPTAITLQNKVQLNGRTDAASKISFCNNHKLCAIKFRPADGETKTYQVASAAAQALMRVEEMYFISIEAQAHLDAAAGKSALESFMKTYRYATYSCKATAADDVIEEIVFQKRVELWGEGQTLFDIKRLNYSVTRGYMGTNWYKQVRFNTEGRPAWTNLVFVQTEGNSNKAITEYNNPNTTGVYDQISDSEVGWNADNW